MNTANPFTAARPQNFPTAPSLLNYGDHKVVLYSRLKQTEPAYRTQTLPTRTIEKNILRKYQQKVYESEYYTTANEDALLRESGLKKSGSYWQQMREGSRILVNPFKAATSKEEVRRNTIITHTAQKGEGRQAKSERQLMREELAQLKDKLKSKEKSQSKESTGLIQFYKNARQPKQTPQRNEFAPTPTFFPSEFSFKRSDITP